MVKRERWDAEMVYVNGILQNDLESRNNKPFWKYVKSPKHETFGISALKIICKHILAHLEDHKILTDLQHGFRSGRSCETQLVTTFQDLWKRVYQCTHLLI